MAQWNLIYYHIRVYRCPFGNNPHGWNCSKSVENIWNEIKSAENWFIRSFGDLKKDHQDQFYIYLR